MKECPPSLLGLTCRASVLGVLSLVGTSTAFAEAKCEAGPVPDVNVSGLSVIIPSNGCAYKVMDRDNSYQEVCNSWANHSCGTLNNGHRYKVDKWTSLWAPAGQQFFSASGSTGGENNPVSSLTNNRIRNCSDKVVPDGATRNFSEWDAWRRCTPNKPTDTVVRSYFTGEATKYNIADDWTGTGSVKQSADGRQFEIEWKNTNAKDGRHAEFDISIGRALYGGGLRLGYGTRSANDFRAQSPKLQATAKFTRPVVTGKAHVQAIIWLNKNRKQDANSGGSDPVHNRESVDITVVEWLTPSLRSEYDFIRNGGAADQTNLSNKTVYVEATVNLGGVRYWVFKRQPGDVREFASYFLVRRWNQDYNTGYRYTSLDLAKVIDQVGAADGKNYLRSWYVSSAGWEIAGANGSRSSGNREAKLHYRCVSLPSLNSNKPITAGEPC